MRTVLFGSELGEGFGHVKRLLVIADALGARGWRPVFALRNPVEAFAAFAGHDYVVLQAPDVLPGRHSAIEPTQAAGFGDLLGAAGFGDVAMLRAILHVWQSLLDVVRPSLVVADYSPFLCLATWGGPPTVTLGTGFALPPPHLPEFPPVAEGRTPSFSEGRLLETVRAVQRERGRPAPDTLPALFRQDAHFVVSVPELDPYARWRAADGLGGLLEVNGAGGEPLHPVFAYLAADSPATGRILRALERTGLAGRAYIRNRQRLPGEMAPGRRGAIVVNADPGPLAQAIADAHVIVHHGGSATAHQALLTGRRQVIVPRHLEQALTAQALERLGVAVSLPGGEVPALERRISELVADAERASRATALGAEIRAREPARLHDVVDCCLRLL
jgi:UDP:flavonoid glycosyltransferase YjiC (YdhE family)